MNNYGVYDSIYSDFIESFPTFAAAENYVKAQIKLGIKHFKIVRFLDEADDKLYDVLRYY